MNKKQVFLSAALLACMGGLHAAAENMIQVKVQSWLLPMLLLGALFLACSLAALRFLKLKRGLLQLDSHAAKHSHTHAGMRSCCGDCKNKGNCGPKKLGALLILGIGSLGYASAAAEVHSENLLDKPG